MIILLCGVILAASGFAPLKLSVMDTYPAIQFFVYVSGRSASVKLPDGAVLTGEPVWAEGNGGAQVTLETDGDVPAPLTYVPWLEKTVRQDWTRTDRNGLNFFQMTSDEQCNRVWKWTVMSPAGYKYFKMVSGQVYVPLKPITIWICVDLSPPGIENAAVHVYPEYVLNVPSQPIEQESGPPTLLPERRPVEENRNATITVTENGETTRFSNIEYIRGLIPMDMREILLQHRSEIGIALSGLGLIIQLADMKREKG